MVVFECRETCQPQTQTKTPHWVKVNQVIMFLRCFVGGFCWCLSVRVKVPLETLEKPIFTHHVKVCIFLFCCFIFCLYLDSHYKLECGMSSNSPLGGLGKHWVGEGHLEYPPCCCCDPTLWSIQIDWLMPDYFSVWQLSLQLSRFRLIIVLTRVNPNLSYTEWSFH